MEMASESMMAQAMPIGGTNPDDVLWVKFFDDPLQNDTRSKEEGRPIFEMTTWISIRKPGSRDEIVRPIRHTDKARFPRHWQAYKSKEDLVVEGTLLAEWPVTSRSQVEELKYWNVMTVEQLAAAADSGLSVMRGFVTLKESAKKWLESSKGTAAVEALAKANAKIAGQEAKISELLDRMEEMERTMAKPARKRRSKAEMAEAKELAAQLKIERQQNQEE